MNTLYIILTPVIQTITIIAFLGLIVLVLRTIAKMFPKTVATLKTKTAFMGWDYDEEKEDPYHGFKIHHSNYLKAYISR